ncbi:solute carrier family 22 member 13-like [Arctopsyche grandis]|uniref:solute carrier family 22 member 13-like n=1 Tax=Arctopsyche grandis TaxID=121162 RepID=UPI00406D6A81
MANVDIDTMLEKAGDFGRYQVFLMVLFSIVNLVSAFHYFSQTFISVIPEHWCNITELQDFTEINETTAIGIREMVMQLKDPNCNRFDPFNESMKCDTGWIYNRDNGFESIVSELNWVCDDDWKPVLGQSTFFIGSVLGTLVLGVLSDRIGRLPVLCIANFLALVGNISTIFAVSLPTFATFRFLSGLATDSNFVMMYIIVMEYVRPSMRTMGLNLCIGVFYCIGCVAVPLVAMALGTWRRFLMATSLPITVVLGYYFVVPESAQWLVSRGRAEEAAQCFKTIAKINGRQLSSSTLDAFIESSKETKSSNKSPSLLGLFATPRLRKKTCILIFKSMVLTLCYDAISRNINGLGFSPFLVFSLSSLTILPSCIIILLLQDKIGRKAMASSSLLISGLFTAIAGVLLSLNGKADPLLTASIAALGRLGVNVAYNSGAQYAAELIPTEVRGQGVAAVHVAGYAATFFSSYILYLGTFSLAIPPLLLGSLSVLCAALCLLLPETLGRSLPTTLEDGEEFGEGERIWDFACCKGNSISTSELIARSG